MDAFEDKCGPKATVTTAPIVTVMLILIPQLREP